MIIKNKKSMIKNTFIDIFLLFLLTLGFFWRLLFENKFLFFGSHIKDWYFDLFKCSTSDNFFNFLKNVKDLNIFYPFNFVLSSFIHFNRNIDTGFRFFEIIFIMHFFMMAVFTYLLIKIALNLHRLSSIFGALSFAFSGVFVTHILDFSFFYSVTWMPLIFLFYLKSLKSNYKRNIIFSGIIMAISMLSGNSYGLFYISIIIMVYFLFGLTLPKLADRKKVFLNSFFILFLGLFLSSSFFKLNYLFKSKPIFEEVLYYIQLPGFKQFIISSILPDFYIRLSNWYEFFIYPGIVTLILSGLFVTVCDKSNENYKFFLIFSIVSLILFFGLSYKGILLDAYLSNVPALQFFNYPIRLRILFNFSLAITASFGMDVFVRAFKKSLEIIYIRYVIFITAIVTFLASIVLPVYYIKIIQEFNKIFIMRINNLSWLFIILFFTTLIMWVRVIDRRRIVLGIILIFLLVVDIFSFWSDINPKEYMYGRDYEILAPSKTFK